MSTPWRLVPRHLREHYLRSFLTITAVAVAVFLFCFLVSIVTSLDAAVKTSARSRLVVKSAVSLFVDLPLDYQSKIASLPGVRSATKFQWFGGYYQDPGKFFAQFGVDQDEFFAQYEPDLEIIAGPDGTQGAAARRAALDALARERRGAIIGVGLARDFGFQMGATIPLTGTIFPRVDGRAWEFLVVGIYRPLKSNVDDRTLWFRFDYLQETLKAGQATGPAGAGTFVIEVAAGHDPGAVTAQVDAMFQNGPQRTQTSTEAAFQAGFVSMMGNLPMFLGSIGGAVVFAVFFSVFNTMLMAGRQRRHEAGILKALGFGDGVLARLLLAEAIALTLAGGCLGAGVARASEELLRRGLGAQLPLYAVQGSTLLWGLAISLAIGLCSGLAPAWGLARLKPTDALRGTD